MTEPPHTTTAARLGDLYRRSLAEHGYEPDPAQIEVVGQLQRLADEIIADSNHGAWRRWLKRAAGRPATPPRGLYLWGGVGTGKTFLMDLFFDALPVRRKQRLHFYRFMQEIHALLKRERNRRNPLEAVANRLTQQTKVLCLDEFFVSDITDAMILHHLLRALFDKKLVLVTTSNIPPPKLYRDGLQRERFLPAISLIERHTRVVRLDARTDYRLRMLEAGEVYHHPCGRDAENAMAQNFCAIDGCADGANPGAGETIEVNGRDVPVVRHSCNTAWFDFKAICEGPRSPADYILIAHLYHTVLISNVPLFDQRDDMARRFIQLVDEFYDRNVKLIVSAAAAPADLYCGGRLGPEFNRTASRLSEMQSRRYLSQAHRG